MTVESTLRNLQKDVGELVSVHDRGRDLSDFECYETDPAGFIREKGKCRQSHKKYAIKHIVI